MKRTILTLTMIILACGFVFGQTKAEQEIRKLFDMTAEALVKNDVTALSNYFAADLTFTIAVMCTVATSDSTMLAPRSVTIGSVRKRSTESRNSRG